jgi:hypothetical protein
MGAAAAWTPVKETDTSAWKPVTEAAATSEKSLGDHLVDAAKSFWQTVSPVAIAKGLNDTLKQSPSDTAKAYGEQNAAILKNAKDAWERGDHSSAIAHGVNYLLNGIPGVGATLDQAQMESERGDVGAALGRTGGLGAVALVPHIPGAVSATADAAKALVTNPRFLRGAGGVLGAGTGEAIGHAVGVPGVGGFAGGFAGREIGAALADAMNREPLAPSGPSEAAQLSEARIAESRAENPGRGVQPIAHPAPAPFVPQAPGALPSGRVPGRPAIDSVTGQIVPGIGNGEFATSVPDVPKVTVAPRVSPRGSASSQPVPVSSPNPTTVNRGTKQAIDLSRDPSVIYDEQGMPLMKRGTADPAELPFGGGPRTMYPETAGERPYNPGHNPEEDLPNTSNTFRDAEHLGARNAIAQKAAAVIDRAGITPEDLKSIETDPMAAEHFWNNVAKIPGLSKQRGYAPSEVTKEATRQLLEIFHGDPDRAGARIGIADLMKGVK